MAAKNIIGMGIGPGSSIKYFLTLGLDIDLFVAQIYTADATANPTPSRNVYTALSPTGNATANPTPSKNTFIG